MGGQVNMGIVASCRKGAWIAAVVGILAVLGCGRVAVRDTAAYADGEYLCDVLVPHRESEITWGTVPIGKK